MQESAFETLFAWSGARRSHRLLDLATGGGFLARRFAPHVAWSLGMDLVVDMLLSARETARDEGVDNVGFFSAVVEDLPLQDASFDIVTTRRGPHHFADIPRALDEIRRILRPGGLLLVEDLTVPEDTGQSEWVNTFHRLISPSHGRALSPGRWRDLLEAKGFVLEHQEVERRSKDLGDQKQASGPEVWERLQAHLDALEPNDAAALGYREEGPRLDTQTVLLAARV